MVNFDTLVQNILLCEAVVGVPDWFNGLLNKHKELFGVDVTDEDLNDFFNLLDDTRISEVEGLKDLNKIRILDIMKNFYDSMESPKPENLNNFKTAITNNSDKFKNKISKFLTLNKSNRLSWVISNSKIKDLKARSEKLAGQKGADTLIGEYGNDFIIPAVQKIVKKRIDFFTRVLRFKSPTTPFTNLITDVFKYPLQYKSGAKKYTSDFEEVDKFYIDNLIEIALAAQDFYVSEITQLKLTQQDNAGLNLFELMVGQILNEQTPSSTSFRGGETTTAGGLVVPSSYKPTEEKPTTTQSTEIPKEVINKLKEEVLSEQQIPNKINFYLGKSINYNLTDPQSGEDTDKVLQTIPANYKINQLQKNPRAKTLIQLLSQVGEYTKKKPGAGERMKQLGSAADATLAAMGVKLYGG
jgi:hypothetical protein